MNNNKRITRKIYRERAKRFRQLFGIPLARFWNPHTSKFDYASFEFWTGATTYGFACIDAVRQRAAHTKSFKSHAAFLTHARAFLQLQNRDLTT